MPRGDRTELALTITFLPTFQDPFYFSDGYPSLVTSPSEGTQELSYSAGYPSSTHYDLSETLYDDTYASASQVLLSDSPLVALAAPAHTAVGYVGPGQPMPSAAHALPRDAQNVSTNVPVTTSAPPASNVAPSAPATQATQGRFQCPLCPNTFDRISRANACHNNHLELKPHVCQGACGNMACNAAYGSVENLHRHIRPPAERKVACARCARSFLKQNISRHKKSCL